MIVRKRIRAISSDFKVRLLCRAVFGVMLNSKCPIVLDQIIIDDGWGCGRRWLPRGGCNMSPFFSQVPMGWMSAESTRRQKSLVLSLPSRRRRSRTPVTPITVAMQTEVELRGSRASSFMPTLKSLEGGSLDCGRGGDGLEVRGLSTVEPLPAP